MRARTRPASPVSLEYLPALDGIRGVAVVAVIATHTVATIPGGFLSVDVFFALSGYLITSLLVAEWRQSDGISLGRFWSRRARRLLPALFLMLTAVGAGAALWPQIFDSPSLRGDTLATVFYLANWHFIADHTNYFLAAGKASPLLHTWSLAIEEQFYLVWPIVVLAVCKLRRPWRGAVGHEGAGLTGPGHRRRLHVLFAIAVTGALSSAVWMAVLTQAGGDTTRSFYASDTRAQAILVGAALAIGSVLWGPARSRRARAAVWVWGLTGVVGTALLWSLVQANSLVVFRGGFFVAALCTAGIIACVANLPAGRLAAVLCLSPLRYVGRISYGMYLWYWPLVLVFSSTRTHLQGYPLLGVRLVAIISMATASAYLVELPIRRGHLPRWWAPLAMPVAASLAVLTTFLATVGVSDVAAASVTASTSGSVATSRTTTTDPEPVKVLLVGDSVAGTLGVGLGQVMSQYGVVAVNEGSPGCSVSMDQLVKVLWFTDPPGKPCVNGDPAALLAQWRAWVDQFNPDVVIYMARSDVLNQEVDSNWTNIGEPLFDSYLTSRFRQAVNVLGSRGAHVVLLTSPFYDTGMQPSGLPWPEDDPARVTTDNQIIQSMADAEGPSSRSGYSTPSARPKSGLFSGISGTGNVTVIDAGAWLSPGGHYSVTVDGIQARCGDGVHFTVAGGEWLAKRILPVISLLGRPHQATAHSGSWSGPIAVTPPSWYSELPCAASAG
ncbi:MAG TPA: acyltransferase family protein [Acidimicrobiales bacterium]|nr:acyltransferase family protein [Acidimicrobiales bacterium]